MGSDSPRLSGCKTCQISIHAPRMGSDWTNRMRSRPWRFQSTLPGWGATPTTCIRAASRVYFNPRSPDGERPAQHFSVIKDTFISIHAPRMGSDGDYRDGLQIEEVFQSTLPGWGATFLPR